MGKTRSSHTRLRERLPLTPQREQYFRWRGNEISRVEGFTDAVFAFAVTLLVVALEVPHTFEGLMDVVRAFPAFVICFAILMTFWSAHYHYHRRYGLEDAFTRVMTMAVLVLILFSVYPLKFLFAMLSVLIFGLELHNAPHLEGRHQVQTLYLIYGLGLAGVWSLYALLYAHALAKRDQLQLTAIEIVLTRASLTGYLIYVAVSLLSVLAALVTSSDWLPGVVYMLLAPLLTFNGMWFGKQVRSLKKLHAA